jgi:hypothetical protein
MLDWREQANPLIQPRLGECLGDLPLVDEIWNRFPEERFTRLLVLA